MAHSSIVGGSTARRLIKCPGSRRESAKAPKVDRYSFAAEVGTALHEAMELIFSSDDGLTPVDFVERIMSNGVIISQDLVLDKLAPAYDAVLELFSTFEVVEYSTETHVHFVDNPEVFGSADLLCMTAKNRLLVVDYKFGDGVMVEVRDNEQFMFYAAAALETPELTDFVRPAQSVGLVLIQPTDRRLETVSTHHYSPPKATGKASAIAGTPRAARTKELVEFKRDLFNAIKVSEDPEAPTNPGDWCKFCPGEATCPSKTGAARAAVLLNPNDLAQLAANLDTADALESWIASVRKTAHTQLENGAKVPGRKLVAKRASRKWTDETLVLENLRRFAFDDNLTISDVTNTTLLSPAQIEKVFKKLKVDFALVTPYIESKSSGLTMAASDDPRPEAAATLDAALAGLAAVLP